MMDYVPGLELAFDVHPTFTSILSTATPPGSPTTALPLCTLTQAPRSALAHSRLLAPRHVTGTLAPFSAPQNPCKSLFSAGLPHSRIPRALLRPPQAAHYGSPPRHRAADILRLDAPVPPRRPHSLRLPLGAQLCTPTPVPRSGLAHPRPTHPATRCVPLLLLAALSLCRTGPPSLYRYAPPSRRSSSSIPRCSTNRCRVMLPACLLSMWGALLTIRTRTRS